jgi:predicted nucleotide-binding protein
MRERFVGVDGKRRLLEALRQHHLVAGDRAIANAIARRAELVEFAPGQSIIRQGAVDSCVYFILTGSVDVTTDDVTTAIRGVEEIIGEMAAIDPSAPRSANVLARETTLTMKLGNRDFHVLCEKFPSIWKRLALVLSRRLLARSRPGRPRNHRPRVFLGSSTEGVEFVRAFKKCLVRADVEAVAWTDDVFGASRSAIESLEHAIETYDFGIFVLSADDAVTSRKKRHRAPRDNVIFELGLFIGALGRHRTFLVSPETDVIKMPTDLYGIPPCTFEMPQKPSALAARLRPVAEQLHRLIEERGVR